MQQYFVYGYVLKSNMEFNMLTPYQGQQIQGEIQVHVCINNQLIKNNASQNIQVNYEGDEMFLKIGGIVEYRICPQENKLYICATDFAWVESTFLNLPFALFFSHKNMLLLHASSLIYNNIVIPLCAPKGTGKTTVSLGLSKFYPFYSDDTLLLKIENGELMGYYGTKYIKLNKDSYDILICDDGFEMLYKNVQGKAYVSMIGNADDGLIRGGVDKLFFLQREGETVSSERITNKFNKKILLHSNICGSGTLGYEYCKYIEKSSIFKFIIENFEFIKIIFCNNKERIGTTLGEIKEIIEDSIK